MIDTAIGELAPIVGVRRACAAVGEPQARWYRRHRQSPPPPRPQRPPAPQPRALTELERSELRRVLNSEEFVDEAPATVYAKLLDAGIYLGSTSTMYRVLREHDVLVVAALPFVVINVAEGVREVPKDLVDMSRSYGVPRPSVIRHLVLPSLSPFLFASTRVSLSVGWRALILGEIFAATSGAGYKMAEIWERGDTAGLIGFAVYFVIFDIALDRIFDAVARHVFRWRPTTAGDPGRTPT